MYVCTTYMCNLLLIVLLHINKFTLVNPCGVVGASNLGLKNMNDPFGLLKPVGSVHFLVIMKRVVSARERL